MAINTRERRASTIAISLYSAGPSIQAGSAGLDDEDRAMAGYGYMGISAGAAPAGGLIGALVGYGGLAGYGGLVGRGGGLTG